MLLLIFLSLKYLFQADEHKKELHDFYTDVVVKGGGVNIQRSYREKK